MPFATSKEISLERDWAVDVGRNAANCLGGLYNLLLGLDEEETVADVMARRDEIVRVLDTEIRTVESYKCAVLAEINRRLDDRRVEAPHDAHPAFASRLGPKT